ncbi:MAG: 50S ribosomal protein L16 [Candidatus Nitrosocaldus sp.]
MKGRNYRAAVGMAYARREYIAGVPQPKIAKFTGGAAGNYSHKVMLVSDDGRAQVRHNALEAARVAANKILQSIGESSFFSVLKVYPHVVLRENKMIATAGADRLQEGMRRAFGKPVGLAARIDNGQTIIEVHVNEQHVNIAKEALKVASSKLPIKTKIVVEPLSNR